jgi:hypothetical protein
MIKLPAVEYVDEGEWLRIKKPRAFRPMVDGFLGKLKGWVQVTLTRPGKPRTTGWKSQNHHVNGHCQQISHETGCSFEAVKMRMKELTPGWQMDTMPDGSAYPKSEGEATTVEAAALIETIHAFAAEYQIILIEGDA